MGSGSDRDKVQIAAIGGVGVANENVVQPERMAWSAHGGARIISGIRSVLYRPLAARTAQSSGPRVSCSARTAEYGQLAKAEKPAKGITEGEGNRKDKE